MQDFKVGDQVDIGGTEYFFTEEYNGRMTFRNNGPDGTQFSLLILPVSLVLEWVGSGQLVRIHAQDSQFANRESRIGVHLHNWKNYIGLTETYMFCECGEKTS